MRSISDHFAWNNIQSLSHFTISIYLYRHCGNFEFQENEKLLFCRHLRRLALNSRLAVQDPHIANGISATIILWCRKERLKSGKTPEFAQRRRKRSDQVESRM